MKVRWFFLSALWLFAAGWGAWALSNYKHTPGPSNTAPGQWPLNSKIEIERNQPVLVLFAHPQCPCTRASIGELNRLMARCEGKLKAHVLFIQPTELPKDWTQSALWKMAAEIPGVQVHADFGGQEAQRFGAESSGHVFLYDAQGGLLFQGGITSERGHEGDNTGENAILALLCGGKESLRTTPVYGCGLVTKTE